VYFPDTDVIAAEHQGTGLFEWQEKQGTLTGGDGDDAIYLAYINEFVCEQ